MVKQHSNDIFLARQPIFDRSTNVIGYELLFRSGYTNTANVANGQQATSRVLLNTFVELGLEKVTQRKLAFVNLSRDFVTGAIDIPIKSRRLVLEILEDISADQQTLEGIMKLRRKGYMVALDDFVPTSENREFIPYANIIKVDVLGVTPQALRQQVEALSDYPVKLLAEKVEDMETYSLCHELGFDYFQGYFFARPALVHGREIPPNQLAILELVSALQSPDLSMDMVEEIIQRDLGMSYKILRVINSSYYGLSSKIESIKHALIMLGTRTLKSWLTIFSMSMLNNKPAELISLALQRARMCEVISRQYECRPEAAFTVGMFSLLDVMMDLPLDELLDRLPFTPDITKALLDREGILGEILNIAVCYEEARWQELESCPFSILELRNIYLDTLTWASELTRQLKDGISVNS